MGTFCHTQRNPWPNKLRVVFSLPNRASPGVVLKSRQQSSAGFRVWRRRFALRACGRAIDEPGVITGELQQKVREQKLFYPPDPASLHHCSIGGNVAINAGGPRCLKYGVTRHYIIGLEVVLANGDILRTGGRVHKNKTGFDLIGLFVGSEGMLGVVTEITVRLLPQPPARATMSVSFATMSEAAATVQKIFAAGFFHRPWRLQITSRSRLRDTMLPPAMFLLETPICSSMSMVTMKRSVLK